LCQNTIRLNIPSRPTELKSYIGFVRKVIGLNEFVINEFTRTTRLLVDGPKTAQLDLNMFIDLIIINMPI